MKARRTLLLALAVAAAGCGHAVEPRAPYDDPAAVPVPRALAARVDLAQGIFVTWSATAADRAIVDAWLIERRTSDQIAFLRRFEQAAGETTFVDGAVADGARYVYRVRGVTAAGVIGLPGETAPVRADLVAPAAPTHVAAATAPGGIALTFTAGPDADIALFEARLVATAGGEAPLFRQVSGSPALLDGLTAGVEYAIEVAAIDSAGRISAPGTPPATAVAGP